jgi:hypothetical protein
MSGSYGGAYHATTRDPDRKVNIGNPRLRGLINTTNSYRRPMNVQILMKYEAVEAFCTNFRSKLSPPDLIQTFSPLKARTYQCLR